MAMMPNKALQRCALSPRLNAGVGRHRGRDLTLVRSVHDRKVTSTMTAYE
jgi:hypothetical protein